MNCGIQLRLIAIGLLVTISATSRPAHTSTDCSAFRAWVPYENGAPDGRPDLAAVLKQA
jgi:hypothetical protein